MPNLLSDTPVLRANPWPSNADLILDVAKLGYLRQEWVTMEPTWGDGKWWKKFRPDTLIAHDIKLDGVDFRKLPEADGSVDVIALDAPYVSPGGRKTSTITDFNARYGLTEAPRTPRALQDMINDGITEAHRVTRKLLLVKCSDYVSSGRLFTGTYHTQEHAHSVGFRTKDYFVHLGKPGTQPPRTRTDGRPVEQQHTRSNFSVLYVFEKC